MFTLTSSHPQVGSFNPIFPSLFVSDHHLSQKYSTVILKKFLERILKISRFGKRVAGENFKLNKKSSDRGTSFFLFLFPLYLAFLNKASIQGVSLRFSTFFLQFLSTTISLSERHSTTHSSLGLWLSFHLAWVFAKCILPFFKSRPGSFFFFYLQQDALNISCARICY